MLITDARKIERIPLTHNSNVEAELRGQVLAEAHKNFGYKADSFNTHSQLARVLSELDIQPLNRSQVEQYKASKRRTYVRRPCFWLHVSIEVFILSCAAALLAYGVRDAIEAPVFHGLSFWDNYVGYIFGAFATILLGNVILQGAFSIGFSHLFPDRKYTWKWKFFDLAQNASNPYPRYVPLHVLNFANQIKNELPTAEFQVDELTLTVENIPRPLPDPFLWVTHDGVGFCIAVWDEKEYEAKM